MVEPRVPIATKGTTVTEIEENTGISRRALMGAALAGGAGALALPGLSGDALAAVKEAQVAYPSHPKWRFVFVNHVTTNPFFVPTRYGAEDAGTMTKTTYQWTGSETAKTPEMINAMNAAISGKADGIAVCVVDPHAFDAPTEKALKAGIPVVAYNADGSTANKRLAYIGQDLFNSGVAMGAKIATLVKKGGRIALFIATPGQSNIQPRIDGAQSALKNKGYKIDVITTGADLPGELTKIDAYVQGHSDVKGLFAVDAGSTQGIAQTMQKRGLHAKGVRAGGYDLLPITLDLIKKGHLDFTIDQQPYLQGFQPVIQLFLYKISGGLMAPSNTNTGLLFVTKDNVDPYLTTKSRYEGSDKAAKYIKS
jgi:simple sugar transport system substrate-binding protein